MSDSTVIQPETNGSNNTKKRGNVANLKPFKKKDPETGANDPRINMNGAPKKATELTALIQEVLGEEITVKGKKKKRIRAMLENMISDKQPSNKKLILEYGYGKVPDVIKTDEPLRIIIQAASSSVTEESNE